MKPSERRKQMKDEMAQRMQESYNNKDGSGKYKPIFLQSKLGSVGKWKCQEGEHFINIIPYVAGKHNPMVAEGRLAYMLDIQVHSKVGVNEDNYVCLQRTYGKPCPICEFQMELRKQEDFDEKYAKSLNPSRRVIYNIECIDSAAETGKIQYWDVSHYLFEKELSEVAKKPRGGGFILFAHYDEGKQIFFRKTGSGQMNTKYGGFQFMDRPAPISDELMDSAICLDEAVHIPSYAEVSDAFHAADKQDEQEEPAECAVPIRKVLEVFECRGSRPSDFGTLADCDECPEGEKCCLELQDLDIPDLDIPDLDIPDLDIPDLDIPVQEVPEVPEVPPASVGLTGRRVRNQLRGRK